MAPLERPALPHRQAARFRRQCEAPLVIRPIMLRPGGGCRYGGGMSESAGLGRQAGQVVTASTVGIVGGRATFD